LKTQLNRTEFEKSKPTQPYKYPTFSVENIQYFLHFQHFQHLYQNAIDNCNIFNKQVVKVI